MLVFQRKGFVGGMVEDEKIGLGLKRFFLFFLKFGCYVCCFFSVLEFFEVGGEFGCICLDCVVRFGVVLG